MTRLPLALLVIAGAAAHRPRAGSAKLWACRTGNGSLALSPTACARGRTVASGTFDNRINATGWSQLEVVGTEGGTWEDELMAYAAGALEGRLTADLTYWHWLNTVSGYCDGVEAYCRRLEAFLERNWAYMLAEISARPTDPYWMQVSLVLHQLAGLVDGYYDSVGAPHTAIDVRGFLMFQLAGDLESIEQALKKPAWKLRKVTGSGSCSALVKVVGDPTSSAQDVLFAHDTWSTYQSMLRVLKLYRLPFTHSAAQTITFSGYPGTLSSIDDFYLASSGLAVTETTIGNSNASRWQYQNIVEVRPVGSVLAWIRSTVANRLARSAPEWSRIFTKRTSGTYNNQWMVLDYKSFRPGQPLPDSGLFVVLEQIPGKTLV